MFVVYKQLVIYTNIYMYVYVCTSGSCYTCTVYIHVWPSCMILFRSHMMYIYVHVCTCTCTWYMYYTKNYGTSPLKTRLYISPDVTIYTFYTVYIRSSLGQWCTIWAYQKHWYDHNVLIYVFTALLNLCNYHSLLA